MQSTPPDKDFPYWLVAAAVLGLVFAYVIATSALYTQIIGTLQRGLWITIMVTLIAFTAASLLGLMIAVMALSRSLLLRQIARFYVEIIRGIPILVLLFYIAFVGAPALIWLANGVVDTLNAQLGTDIGAFRTRDLPLLWRAVIALTIGYSAFISEVFRAGILSVDSGQVEAAKALGFNGWHRFRLIVFPQAIRTILPPLGNDFVALVKDSSLVSVVGVADIAQIAKTYSAGSFRYLETYTVVAYLYLLMTITLSLALRALERRLRRAQSERDG